MTVPTVPVTIKLADFGGPAVAGVKITLRPSGIDATADGTFVSSEPITVVTDANGQAIANVFPNAVAPTGLGTKGTTIRVTASIPRSRGIDVQAVIPNAPCNLVDVQVDEDPVGLDAAQLAILQAQDSAIEAIAASEQAAASEAAAAISDASASASAAAALISKVAAAASAVDAGTFRDLSATSELAASGYSAVAAAAAQVVTAAMAALGAIGYGFQRFIDANTGNDANDGLTSATPWRSFAPVLAMGAAISGKAIGIARGSVFNTEIVLTAPNVRIGAYGNILLANPLFDPRVPVVGAWTNVSGNTWSISVACVADPKNKGNIFRNGGIMRQYASQAAMEAAAVGGCFVTDWTVTPRQIFITSITNPNTDGSSYKHPFWGTGLTISGDYWLIEDIDTIGPAHQDGSFRGIGYFGTQRRCKHTMGARHCCYTRPNSLTEDCVIGPSYNPLEGTANTLVVNDTATAGLGYTVRRTKFTGRGLPADVPGQVTGPLQHDGVPTTLMGVQLIEDCTFQDLVSWATISGDMRVIRPVFDNVTGGASSGTPGFALTLTDTVAGATIDQLFDVSVGGTATVARSTFNIRMLSTGFYRQNTSLTDLVLRITGVTEIVSAGVGLNAQLMRVARGSVSRFDCNLTQPGDGALCFPCDQVLALGFSAASTFVGNRNTYPFGMQWQLNGASYFKLTDWQAATAQEGASTRRAPVALGSDNFDRADENLEVNAFWTRVGGVAAQAAVRTNQLAGIATTQTLYKHDAAAVDHWIGFSIAQVPVTAGPYMALRASDQNNWLGIRWTTTQFQIGRCLAGALTASVVGTPANTPTPTVGQQVITAMKGDGVYAYIDERAVQRGAAMAAGAIGANLGVGVVPRGSIVNPFVDSFQYGTV